MINIIKTKTSIAHQVAHLPRQQYVRMTPALLHTSSIQQKSIIEKAKDLGENLNKKVGQKLAQGIEGAEHIVHETPSAKDLGEKVKHAGQGVNKKVGEKLAEGINKAENSASNLKHQAETVNDKAARTKEEAKDTVDKVKHRAKDEAEDASEKIKRKLD